MSSNTNSDLVEIYFQHEDDKIPIYVSKKDYNNAISEFNKDKISNIINLNKKLLDQHNYYIQKLNILDNSDMKLFKSNATKIKEILQIIHNKSVKKATFVVQFYNNVSQDIGKNRYNPLIKDVYDVCRLDLTYVKEYIVRIRTKNICTLEELLRTMYSTNYDELFHNKWYRDYHIILENIMNTNSKLIKIDNNKDKNKDKDRDKDKDVNNNSYTYDKLKEIYEDNKTKIDNSYRSINYTLNNNNIDVFKYLKKCLEVSNINLEQLQKHEIMIDQVIPGTNSAYNILCTIHKKYDVLTQNIFLKKTNLHIDIINMILKY